MDYAIPIGSHAMHHSDKNPEVNKFLRDAWPTIGGLYSQNMRQGAQKI
jgi:hypothetical protein